VGEVGSLGSITKVYRKRKVNDIKKLVGPKNCRIIGDAKRGFDNVQPIDTAQAGDLTFCVKKGDESIRVLQETKAGIVICDVDILSKNVKFDDKTLVAVESPKLWFMRCVDAFFRPKTKKGIHPTVIFGKNCKIAKDVYIGPYVTIGDDVIIENGTRLDADVHIYDRVTIGRNCVIKSGSVIGGDGFGYERNNEGILEKFPHVGGVIIEDNVDIGANTCVDRGTLSDTIIGEGTKIDNLVHVGHNAAIGKHCVITAFAMIPRSKIGDGAWIAPNASMLEGTVIGKKALVGMGAVVIKNVPDGDVVVGVPAKSIKKGPKG
jgi:UDP-3-O-[3-hydroxymyristoyl] glucosamine N-acyltransferase